MRGTDLLPNPNPNPSPNRKPKPNSKPNSKQAICRQDHGLRGSMPHNRIPEEQQRAVVDFALAHTTVDREQMSLQLRTRSVTDIAARVARFA